MKNFTILLHSIIVLLAYSAWIWLDYRVVAILAVAHIIMLEVLQGCPLSQSQFPDHKDKRFYEWWMDKVGVTFTKTLKRKMRIFMQYVLPFVIIGLSIIWQLVIGVSPLLGL